MAKLKCDEANLYDKLAATAPTMTQGDLLYSVEKTPRPTSQLPECVEEMYTHIGDPQKFRVALAAGQCLVNIYKHNREDVYELLQGDKYMKPPKKRNLSYLLKFQPPNRQKQKFPSLHIMS